MSRVISIIAKILLEGKLKESLEKIWFRYHNSLYALNKLIKHSELLPDGTILLELTNGLKFYGQPNKREREGIYGIGKERPLFKYGDQMKLNKLMEINLECFGAFLSNPQTNIVTGLVIGGQVRCRNCIF